MTTSFNVNKADLEFILKQIILAETTSQAYTATPLTMLQAIQAAFPGVTDSQASLLPFGLRTVDGSDNNLMPGQGDFGAADTLFPRLTDPVFRNEQDGDQMPLGPGAPVITNTNYDPTIPGSHSVADADPRIISNLIVDMTAGNPAAVEAALKYLVFTGAMDEATAAAAAPAIAAAYALTVQTRVAAAPANVAALAATVTTEITEQGIAQGAYNAAVLADAGNADNAADAAALSNLVGNAKATVDALYASIIVDTDSPFDGVLDVNALDTVNLAAAVAAADAASVAASALVTQLGVAHLDYADAQAIETSAIALDAAMEALAIALADSIVNGTDGSDLVAAQSLANANVAPAQSLTADLTALVDLSGQVATTLTALNMANTQLAAAQSAYNAASSPATVAAADAALAATLATYGVEVDPSGSLVIPNTAPDAGLTAPFNSAMTFFGQFFDHGLDLVTKGNAGTVYIPLMADDPLIAGGDGILGTGDDLPAHLRFMALTRATVTLDANGVPQHENTTTSFVDQNQTYTSHSSHQVFLREYVRVDVDPTAAVNMQTLTTGHLIDGSTASGSSNGAPGNWAEVKAQALEMLGIKLNDFDVHNAPLLVTDQYGKFIPGANGYAQVVAQVQIINTATGQVVGIQNPSLNLSGIAGGLDLANLPVPGGLPALAPGLQYKTVSVGTGHAFLNDIAHHAAPSIVDVDAAGVRDGIRSTVQVADNDFGIGVDGFANSDFNKDGIVSAAELVADDHNELTYDDEMLNSHFITGDGRGNENIGLTAMHSVFHSEHNRMVEANKATILASGDMAFINAWLRTDIASLADIATQGQKDALIANDAAWDGERLFQAARFTTEMQYQHLVFEEFARRVQPDVDPFIFNPDSTIDASILAEFAHTVYRFGHTMLTGTVDRLENDLTTVNGEADQQTLLAAFLNPQMYVASGVDNSAALANVVRGLTRDVGNAIDEFIVQDLRSNLLGLPLDLAVLNIARGRDTGIPSLNETRQQLHDAGVSILTPYTSWLDFESNINNKLSSVNFMAAYGTHAAITGAATAADARDAALLLRIGDGNDADGVTIRGVTYSNQDRLDFLNATGAYAGGSLGGLNKIDLWIGGLAEKRPEFGSAMLGQTFNYIFEFQMEQLQFGDRFYYLSRTQGMNLLNQLEPNTFSDLVMRNSELGGIYATHMSSALFLTPDHILELDRGIAQEDYNGSAAGNDPHWGTAPSLPVEKVTRDYTNSITVDGTHDFGGSIIFRGAEHTVIGGTEGNDYIRTDEGDDTIWGDGGNDHLLSGDGVDNVFGGDGDDIIEDIEGAGDFLRGERGNDVIVSARGAFDVLFGGEGKDFVQVGVDVMEVFAGEGDDFVLGGAGSDLLMGNEGNDWIEGGGGFDTLVGENSDLFFNSPVIGHDVLFGNGDETDMDAESGDDIMASSPSVFRNEGMFGFDWGIAKFDPSQIDFDLTVPVFTTDQADILRDRWDQVEALSGWKGNDLLSGDNTGGLPTALLPDPLIPTAEFVNNTLTQEGIDRIDGFSQFLAGARATLGLGTTFREGNILMGGDGNDVIQGRGGYDIIDGDAWLNVRIKINMGNGVFYSAESLSSDTAVMGPNAGKVYATDANGNPVFTDALGNDAALFGGRTLPSLLLDRTINPGQMSIVREILQDNTTPTGLGRNVDTAVFRGTMAEYIIEGLETDNINYTGEVVQQAFDVNGDGFISVRDKDNGDVGAVIQALDANGVVIDVQLPTRRLLDANGLPLAGGGFTDDLDLLRNIEQVRFSDRTYVIGDPITIVNWNGVRPGENALPANGVVIANLTTTDVDNTPVTWSMIGGTAPVTVSAAGVVTTTAALAVNSVYTLTVRATETANPLAFVDKAITIRTGSGGDNTITGDGLTDVIYGLTGDDTLNGLGGRDTLFGQADDDILNGGAGSDDLTGGTGDDEVNGGTHNDTIRYVIGDGADTVDGGADIDTLVLTSGVGNDTLAVTLDAAGVITNFQGGSVIGVESVTANLDGGTDTLNYTAPGGVTVNLVSGTATGFTSIAGIENVNTAGGNDTVTGDGNNNVFNAGGGNDTINAGGGNDTINGEAGNDSINGEAGNDTIIYAMGGGADNVNGGADNDQLNVITNVLADDTLDVIVTGGVVTSIEGGSVTNVEAINVDLGGGNNTISYVGSTSGVTVNLGAPSATGLASLANTQNVIGTAQADTLRGSTAANILNGGAGNDTFTYVIGGGADTVIGGLDNDTLVLTAGGGNDTLAVTLNAAGVITNFQGGSVTGVESVTANLDGGTDTLSYTAPGGVTVNLVNGTATGFTSIDGIENVNTNGGSDTVTGDGNNNVLNAGANDDTLNGGGGNDTLNGGTGNDTVNGNAGNDTIIYAMGGGADNVNGGADTDTLSILTNVNADDTLDVIVNAAGVVTSIEGGSVTNVEAINVNLGQGSDRISYAGSAIGVTVNLGGLGAPVAGTGLASLANTENVTGTAQADILTGSTAANNFNGGAGADSINGAAGDDIIDGGAGNDIITYAMGGGADNVNGGADADTLNIIATNANDQLDVIVNGGVVTSIEGGSVTSVETINVNLSGGNNTISYAGSASGVTVNLGGLGAPVAGTGLASLANTQNVTGTAQADTLIGSTLANILNGGAGADTINGAAGDDSINGGTGGDTLIGGIGSDIIDTGAANDNVVDLIQFTDAVHFGDTINNFDADGTVDRVEFGGNLNTLFDNGTNDDNIQFVSGNGANGGNIAANMGISEALFLDGNNGEGVTNANLGNAAAVATEFNEEFNLTAPNNQATLLVINDTNGNSAAVWRWIQADGDSDNAIDAAELTLIGVVNANATVTTASFDFF